MLTTLVLQLVLLAGILILFQILLAIRIRHKTTRLQGPRSESLLFGVLKAVSGAPDQGAVYERWAEKYGPAFQIPGPLATKRIVVCDPKAVTHVCAMDSWKYAHTPIAVRLLSNITGPTGLLCILGEEHKRQRRILNPVFGPSAIKSYTPLFFDAGYKVKTAWDAIIQSTTSEEVIINVSEWMEHVSLDVIGLAAFSHDFGCLLGRTSPVTESLAALGHFKPSPVTTMIMLLSQAFPWLLKLPMPRNALVAKFSDSMSDITGSLLQKARADGNLEKSALGTLLNSENTKLSEMEVRVHMKSLLFAGNETTAVSLKWALIELSKEPEKQDKLRTELAAFGSADLTYEDLAKNLSYLDAVVREAFRLHPFGEITRMALVDDVIPLARPATTASGETVDRLMVAKGTIVTIPIQCINRAESIWGGDCKAFVPERWLTNDGLSQHAKEYPGYHHTLTFLDGPRTCLGKGFAIFEIKAVLSVLIRHYKFLPRDGPDTKYAMGRRIVPHPMVAGEEGNRLPMRVTRVE